LNGFPWSRDAGRYVELGDCKLHVADEGEGPTVLLLHGWGRSYATWNKVGPALAKRRRVLAPDMPGLGWSTRPDKAAGTYARHAEFLLRLMDAEGLDRAAMVGNSFGGAVALHLALNHPDRVDVLALLAPLGYRTPITRAMRAVGRGRFLGRFLWSFMTPKRISHRLAGLSSGKGEFPPPTRGELEAELVGLKEYGGGAPGLRDALVACIEDLAWRVDELEPPTLVICGMDDPLVPAQLGSDLAQGVQEGRFEGLFHAGHFPHEEQTQQVLDLLTTFLAGRENRRGPDNFSLVVDGT